MTRDETRQHTRRARDSDQPAALRLVPVRLAEDIQLLPHLRMPPLVVAESHDRGANRRILIPS
jgi:hypothetical protein